MSQYLTLFESICGHCMYSKVSFPTMIHRSCLLNNFDQLRIDTDLTTKQLLYFLQNKTITANLGVCDIIVCHFSFSFIENCVSTEEKGQHKKCKI